MPACPAIKVKHATRGFMIINEDDFDADTHEMFDEKARAKVAEKTDERIAIEAEAELLDVKFSPKLGDDKLQERVADAKAKVAA